MPSKEFPHIEVWPACVRRCHIAGERLFSSTRSKVLAVRGGGVADNGMGRFATSDFSFIRSISLQRRDALPKPHPRVVYTFYCDVPRNICACPLFSKPFRFRDKKIANKNRKIVTAQPAVSAICDDPMAVQSF